MTAIAGAGFDAVELFENDLLACALRPGDVRRMMADLGLACAVFQPFRDFESMLGELRARTFDRLERKFDLMAELGTDLMLICANVDPRSSGDRARILDDFAEAGERAAEPGGEARDRRPEGTRDRGGAAGQGPPPVLRSHVPQREGALQPINRELSIEKARASIVHQHVDAGQTNPQSVG